MRWTRKTIISEIKRLHEAGEKLNYSTAEDNHLNLVRAAAWHFGTWRRAIESAGIDYESLSRYKRWNKARIVERIQELHKQNQDLSWRSVSMEIDPSLAAAALRPNGFSSWREAVAAAGIDVDDVARYKYWDEAKVLKAIRARKRAGEPMSSKSLQTTDQSLYCAARRRYGSWDAALDAAGLKAENIRLRRHNPRLNAPRKKKEEKSTSPNGQAVKPIQLAAKVAAKPKTKSEPKPKAEKKPASKATTANKSTGPATKTGRSKPATAKATAKKTTKTTARATAKKTTAGTKAR